MIKHQTGLRSLSLVFPSFFWFPFFNNTLSLSVSHDKKKNRPFIFTGKFTEDLSLLMTFFPRKNLSCCCQSVSFLVFLPFFLSKSFFVFSLFISILFISVFIMMWFLRRFVCSSRLFLFSLSFYLLTVESFACIPFLFLCLKGFTWVHREERRTDKGLGRGRRRE